MLGFAALLQTGFKNTRHQWYNWWSPKTNSQPALEQCFSTFNAHPSRLGTLLKSGSDIGLGTLYFAQAPSWCWCCQVARERPGSPFTWTFFLSYLPQSSSFLVSQTLVSILWLLVFATKTHCLACDYLCSQNGLCKVKIWSCHLTV